MKTANAPVWLVLSSVLAACGGASEPAKAPAPAAENTSPAAEAPAKGEAEAPAATPAAVPESAPAAEPAGTGLDKAALREASKIVSDAYPGPFEKTYESVVAKLGEPKKKSDNMYEWFAKDGGKCLLFFMTKDAKKGHAASGVTETDAAECK